MQSHKNDTTYKMGIDIGSTTVKVVLADEENKIAFSRIKISSRTIDKINWCGCLFLRNNIELMMCNPVCQPLS